MPNRRWISNRINTLYAPSETDRSSSASWSSAGTRQERYSMLEAFADLTIYSGGHADGIKRDFRTYKKIRPVASPFATIADFHAGHLLGPGTLDPDAGPGDSVPSCLPIIPGKTARPESIHKAVAALWDASNWATRKRRLGRYGAVLGDVGIEVVADERKGKVRLKVVHPGDVIEHEDDDYDHTRHVVFERDIIDPADPLKQRTCKYKRSMTNDDGVVTVRTFRDGKPYAYPDSPGDEWDLPWGFVPFVLINHNDTGKEWGVSELANMLSRGIELDGQESVLNDQTIKAMVMPVWMNVQTIPIDRTNGKPAKLEFRSASQGDERNEHLVLYSTWEGATIEPLVYPVPIGECNDRNKRLEMIIARDYPELLASDPVGLAASGEARREARKSTTTKVNDRREAYDKGLVRAQQMAMTMGGMLGFRGYEGFNERSFDDGLTDHSIGSRPVFTEDPLDILKERKAEAEAIMEYYAGGQGTTLRWAMEQVGIAPDRIENLMEEIATEAKQARELQTDIPPEPDELRLVEGVA